MNSLNKIIITGVDNELSINLALSTNRNLKDMVFGISSSYSSVLVTSFSIGTEKMIYFSASSPKEVNCFPSSFAISFKVKCNHS